MGFISKKKKNNIFHKRNIEREFASEIVEIFEEKLEELDITLPNIKANVRKELISEIEDFIYINKRVLSKKIA
ncbi:MAG: hypothetical protein ACLSW4_02545 [Clostridia bacterium]|jgi:hypothetical protein|nr:hypothetical protein [Clostridium sp.]